MNLVNRTIILRKYNNLNAIKMFKKVGIIVLILSFCNIVKAQDPNFHIYLCFGQSNMEGNGVIEAQDKTGVDARFQVMGAVTCSSNGKTYTKGKWQTATPPIFRCGTGLGVTDYFGRTMVANLPTNVKVGVVPVAVGGSEIALFDKVNYASYIATAPSWMVSYINEYGGNPYARLVEVAKLAQKDGVIKGILFHQGESNNGQTTWPAKVKAVYDNLIKDLGLDPTKTPFLAGELVTTAQGGACGGHNSVIATLPNVIPNSYVISASGLPHKGDNLHFTPASYRTLGDRYAQKMLTLLPKSVAPSVSITSPINNTKLTAPATVNLTATASTTNGTISKVEFFNGTTSIGSVTSSPYTFSWKNVAAGKYIVIAVATDNSGNKTTSATDTIIVTVPQGAYNAKIHDIPGIIQIEEYDVGGNGVAYLDNTPGSAVTPVVNFRTTEDVDIENCNDVGGGYNLGYATAGEWLEYSVNVQTAGNYDLDLRVACSLDGRTLSVSMDGTTIANNVAIPNTSGWQNWQTVSLKNIPLTTGTKVMRCTVGAADYLNLNFVEFKKSIVTDIEDLNPKEEISISPNPFNNEGLNIKYSGAFSYKVVDILGTVLEQDAGQNSLNIGGELRTGIYILSIENEHSVKSYKIIKK